MRLSADIVIVGSGVGGATVARELAIRGRKVLIVEKGYSCPPERLGFQRSTILLWDKCGLWSRTKEGVFYYRMITVGGTAVGSCGNGVRALENELKSFGIDLVEEFSEAERELNIKPIQDNFLGKGTRRIVEAANKLGFNMEPMPKFINMEKCIYCGNCILGCRAGAKWSPLEYLKEAREKGASLLRGINVTKVLVSNGKAIGIEGRNKIGRKIEISANIIVLAAGGIGSPIILQNSGIEAGQKLFLHLFRVTLGLTKDIGLAKEPQMEAVHHNEEFILSPFLDVPLVLMAVLPRKHILKFTQRERLLGIMTKIKDDCLGRVHKDGKIEKTVTQSDLSKLNKGAGISKEILINAGADPKTIITTEIRGAHPGGTAAIGARGGGLIKT